MCESTHSHPLTNDHRANIANPRSSAPFEHSKYGSLMTGTQPWSRAFENNGSDIEIRRTIDSQVQNLSSSSKNAVCDASLPSISTSDDFRTNTLHHAHGTLSAGLRLQTDLGPSFTLTSATASNATTARSGPPSSTTTSGIPIRTPSIKSILSAPASAVGSVSPNSAMSSPALASMPEITPLPSPLVSGGSPGSWKRPVSRPDSYGAQSSLSLAEQVPTSLEVEPCPATIALENKRRAYTCLMPAATEVHSVNSQIFTENLSHHGRNRSLSDYVPNVLQPQRPRHIAVSIAGGPPKPTNDHSPCSSQMHREEYLAAQRGLAVAQPPTPPPSNRSEAESSDSDTASPDASKAFQRLWPMKNKHYEYFTAKTVKGNHERRWRAIRQLGQGTFSKVILATSEGLSESGAGETGNPDCMREEVYLDPKKLVAVKVIEHGPAGGADEQRVESSLKRELEILKSLRHPSLVHLRASSIESTRALLILSYCPGGDLFEVASQKHHVLIPNLIRRIFSELVAAVRCLHKEYIVHRDIKLENVLLNVPTSALSSVSNWQTYPYPIVTLTDLGLSRRIPAPPQPALLTTRCGSEDYAAPELLMGQQYDGCATDAWALGVLLYAIMEGRLPFDPLPVRGGGADAARKMRSRTAHRVARCEWSWVKYGDDEGEPLPEEEFGELQGAREVVEGLLKRARTRLTLDVVQQMDWVRGGISVEGGLKCKEQDDDDA